MMCICTWSEVVYTPADVVVVCFYRLLSQCTEYFDLRCQLLDDLTSKSANPQSSFFLKHFFLIL